MATRQLIAVSALPGQTLFAVIMDSTNGQFWNTSSVAFEGFNAAHWANYVVTLNEFGSTGIYTSPYPSDIADDKLTTEFIYQQRGASPSVADAPPVQSGSTQGTVTLVNDDKTGYSFAAGQVEVKKNQALSAFEFLMVSSSDHVTPVTGLTVAASVSIDGAAFAATVNGVTPVGFGVYKIDLAAADLNGRVITLRFTSVGADARYVSIVTQD